jgi:ribokinase
MVVSAEVLPGAGETVVGAGPVRHGGGKGANAAVAAGRSGVRVRLIGAVGRDDAADIALREVREAGVELEGLAILEAEPTGVALIVVDRRGENQIAVGTGANGALDPAWVAGRTEEAITAGAGCVLVSTEIPGAAVSAAVRVAGAAGVPCVLNTAPPIPAVLELLGAGPVLTPNARELDLLSRMAGADAAAGKVEQAVALAGRTGRPVVVTLGAEGALIAEPDGSTHTVVPPPAAVVDTTGAGDTFSGVLAARLAGGLPLREAVRVAVIAAAISVSRPGARGGMPLRGELDAAAGRPLAAVGQ